MILTASLENRFLKLVVFDDNNDVIDSFKVFAEQSKTKEEYVQMIDMFLRYKDISQHKISGAILSSVVPSLTDRVKNAISEIIEKECLVLSKRLKIGLAIRTDNPDEVGSNLISLSLAGYHKYKEDILIVNMSSVTTFMIVSENKEFIGCSIAPGLVASADTMKKNSAQLLDVDISKPKSLIGKNTKESMKSGIYEGYISFIESYCEKLEREYGKPLHYVLTGEDSSIVKNALSVNFDYNENLLMEGLLSIYESNR